MANFEARLVFGKDGRTNHATLAKIAGVSETQMRKKILRKRVTSEDFKKTPVRKGLFRLTPEMCFELVKNLRSKEGVSARRRMENFVLAKKNGYSLDWAGVTQMKKDLSEGIARENTQSETPVKAPETSLNLDKLVGMTLALKENGLDKENIVACLKALKTL